MSSLLGGFKACGFDGGVIEVPPDCRRAVVVDLRGVGARGTAPFCGDDALLSLRSTEQRRLTNGDGPADWHLLPLVGEAGASLHAKPSWSSGSGSLLWLRRFCCRGLRFWRDGAAAHGCVVGDGNSTEGSGEDVVVSSLSASTISVSSVSPPQGRDTEPQRFGPRLPSDPGKTCEPVRLGLLGGHWPARKSAHFLASA
eukprot:CAMPEP_0204055626 /NCGR_PEP_ID=MMETSP0360-20130528/130808_1 /ASSEMBLY_ACC=CAM_ASM_000342 /TAXON_ID=268821 /ORGANISM="Scrippsiella Hangoei, Strain SHTV-5" /LENGTH=197 /DNA_ID=CAMNT_0051002993 /DNA_START=24 /DNA_END=617 /DNA_ORIENTATION=+